MYVYDMLSGNFRVVHNKQVFRFSINEVLLYHPYTNIESATFVSPISSSAVNVPSPQVTSTFSIPVQTVHRLATHNHTVMYMHTYCTREQN